MMQLIRCKLLLALITASAMFALALTDDIVPPLEQAPGWTCVTPYGWCSLPYPLYPGTQCFCNSPYGPVAGTVR